MKATEIKPNGFCNGVKRAIKMIIDIANDKNTIKPIYMFGYLVHNKKIINSLIEEYNIILIKDNFSAKLKEIKTGTIIFTAHGISPDIYEIAENKKLNIVDTTCPNVLKIQNIIKEKIKENYNVVVIGNKNHPEINSYLGISKKVSLYDKEKDYRNIDNIFVINQTTLIYEDVLKIYQQIKDINPNCEIVEEVCNATKVRQKAILDNLDKYDLFIIIGDKLSNNCDSLYKLAKNYQKDAIKIESCEELNEIDLSKYQNIAVTAGASTPPAILDEVIIQINNNTKEFKSNLKNIDYIKL